MCELSKRERTAIPNTAEESSKQRTEIRLHGKTLEFGYLLQHFVWGTGQQPEGAAHGEEGIALSSSVLVGSQVAT